MAASDAVALVLVLEFAQSMVGMAAGGRGFVPPTSIESLKALLPQVSAPPVSLPASPLMHGTGMWLGAMVPHSIGGTVVTSSKLGLDPHRLSALGTIDDRHTKRPAGYPRLGRSLFHQNDQR